MIPIVIPKSLFRTLKSVWCTKQEARKYPIGGISNAAWECLREQWPRSRQWRLSENSKRPKPISANQWPMTGAFVKRSKKNVDDAATMRNSGGSNSTINNLLATRTGSLQQERSELSGSVGTRAGCCVIPKTGRFVSQTKNDRPMKRICCVTMGTEKGCVPMDLKHWRCEECWVSTV